LEIAGLPFERQEHGITVRDPWNNGNWLSAPDVRVADTSEEENDEHDDS
jgi:hypothetical protein